MKIEAIHRTTVADALRAVGASKANIAKGEMYLVKVLVDRLGGLVDLSREETIYQIVVVLQDLAKGKDGVIGTDDDLLTPEHIEFFKGIASNEQLLKQLVTYFIHKQLSKRRAWLMSKLKWIGELRCF